MASGSRTRFQKPAPGTPDVQLGRPFLVGGREVVLTDMPNVSVGFFIEGTANFLKSW